MLNFKVKFFYYLYGKLAEYLACIWLFLKGYNIIATRYKNAFGEIDIIATKPSLLIFVEVKARKNFSESIPIMTLKQKKRIEAAAKIFLASHPSYLNYEFRFDLIIFKKFMPTHLINIW